MARTRAVIRTNFGDMELRFYPEVAPNHVNNFIELARSGFYNGTIYHRLRPGFMIQGGDANSRSMDRRTHGMGSPGYRLKAEFSNKKHVRGTLAMARFVQPDSAGSQFFICVGDAPWLNGKYTVFGEVVSGMEVADRISIQPRDSNDNPLERVEMKIKIIETVEASGEQPAAEEKEVKDE